MKRARSKAGIGTYLAIAFCALAIAMGAILAAIIARTAGNQVKADIGSALSDLAQQAADKLDRNMFERYREVQLLAQRPDMGAAAAPAARRATLELHQRSYPHYAWIGVTGRDGRVLAATGALLQDFDVSQRPWYRNAQAGTFVGDVHDAVLLAKLLPAPTTEAQRFVDLAFPLADGSGVLGAHLSWQWARELERSVIEPASAHRSVQAIIVDRNGKVLLGPEGLLAKTLPLPSQGNGYQVERWPDGVDYLVGYAHTRGHSAYPGLGWTVLGAPERRYRLVAGTRLAKARLVAGGGDGGPAAAAGHPSRAPHRAATERTGRCRRPHPARGGGGAAATGAVRRGAGPIAHAELPGRQPGRPGQRAHQPVARRHAAHSRHYRNRAGCLHRGRRGWLYHRLEPGRRAYVRLVARGSRRQELYRDAGATAFPRAAGSRSGSGGRQPSPRLRSPRATHPDPARWRRTDGGSQHQPPGQWPVLRLPARYFGTPPGRRNEERIYRHRLARTAHADDLDPRLAIDAGRRRRRRIAAGRAAPGQYRLPEQRTAGAPGERHPGYREDRSRQDGFPHRRTGDRTVAR